MNSEYLSKQTELEQLKNEVAAKSTELEQLKTGIVQAQEAPKHLPAGYFTVGTDIPAGRYSVSGKSNFFLYSAGGDLKVNTILGGGRWGEESYVCYLNDGDIIKANSACTYTPVK